MTSTVFSVYNSGFGIGNDVSTICITDEKEAHVANKLTVEEVQERFIRWGEAGVQDATLRKEFANVPSEELQAILEAGMLGDDHWLRQEDDQWFLVDFVGTSRTCALRIAQTLIANKLLPVNQKPKVEDLDNFTTEELWRLVDLYEFTIACFMDAMHQDPSHEVNRPYRELKKRFDALESNNAKLLQEKQQAVADLGKANGEVAKLKDDLAKKPVVAATVAPEAAVSPRLTVASVWGRIWKIAFLLAVVVAMGAMIYNREAIRESIALKSSAVTKPEKAQASPKKQKSSLQRALEEYQETKDKESEE
ncbi:MAG: hypothetical protein K8Q97_03215 [Candidatus Andersenbacteria bacterium]|nr:hypothetical protein [Candidatus Andersenbacteria bacterium]